MWRGRIANDEHERQAKDIRTINLGTRKRKIICDWCVLMPERERSGAIRASPHEKELQGP